MEILYPKCDCSLGGWSCWGSPRTTRIPLDWTKLDAYCVCVVIIAAAGPCDFQNGLCGLRKDANSEFQWKTDMGATLSENTGPSFDHTTLSSQGNLLRSFDLKLWKNIWHFGLVFHRSTLYEILKWPQGLKGILGFYLIWNLHSERLFI